MITVNLTREVDFPESLEIPGLSFRRFEGRRDFELMAKVLQDCKEIDQVERTDTAEDIERSISHMENCDPYRDVLLAEVNNQAIAYGQARWFQQEDGVYIYLHRGFVLPDWRRKGIGRAILHYNEAHLRECAAGHVNGAGKVLESWVADTEKAATALLLNEGYKPERHFYNMLRADLENIPEAPIPIGLEVRPVEMEHLQAICDASKEAFRDHWGYSEAIEPTVQEWLDDPNTDISLWRVAWDGNQVAGMVLSFIDPKENSEYNRRRGWTENICVRRPWRKRGLARSLLAQSLHALKERGMSEAALGVDTNNTSGALRLYESVGFRQFKRFSIFQKDLCI